MEILRDLWVWLTTIGWLEVVKIFKEINDYKELIVLLMSCVTAVALIFIKRTLKQTVGQIRREVGSIKSDLNKSGQAFRSDLELAISRLKENMSETLDRVDGAGDALSKKVEFVKRELEGVIEDAFAKAAQLQGTAGNSNEPPTPQNENYWPDLKAGWDQTKFEIDLLIEKVVGSLSVGRRRKRYANLNRRDYDAIILKLYEDNWIDDESTDALLEMNILFNSRKNRKRAVSTEELNRFKTLREKWLQASQVKIVEAAE